jgi:hypothetical protein
VTLRAAVVPFAHDEVATFYFYIQPGSFIPFLSHPDANGHFLMSLFGWICFKLAGASPFALRLGCVMASFIMCAAVYRISFFFTTIFPRIIFCSAFVLCYNFLAFYSLCRGYGLAMSFLLLGIWYLLTWGKSGQRKHLFYFMLFTQLALAASLTLVLVLVICDLVALFYQLRAKVRFSPVILTGWLVNFGLLYFWVKYGFYLRDAGALYYGEGDSYWAVTFHSLIETITLNNKMIDLVALLIFLQMLVYWLYFAMKEKLKFITAEFSISFLSLCALILSFFLLHRFMNVNYPEDRTGLFFYIFFMLALAFMVNDLRRTLQPIMLFVPLFFATHYFINMNLRTHPWKVYETMPSAFFSKLIEEQGKTPFPITVAGHRVREFLFGFMNYHSPVKLNHMTAPEALQMNCDYALAYRQDKPWYDRFYTELMQEEDWGFVLLKRRRSIARRLLFESDSLISMQGPVEYCNAYERTETAFNSQNPLLAEFSIGALEVPRPLHAWLVLQIDSEEGNQFIRTPLDLIKYDWNQTGYFRTSLVSATIPKKVKRIVAYIWNIDKADVKMRINTFRLFQLDGEGVNEVSAAVL